MRQREKTETARQTLIFVLCIQQCFCLLMLARRLVEDIKGLLILKRTTYYNPVSARYECIDCPHIHFGCPCCLRQNTKDQSPYAIKNYTTRYL